MKRILVMMMFVMCMHSFVKAVEVDVQINGEIVDFKDSQGNTVKAQIINDRTMVPMRKIFEVLGLTVDWDGENRIVTGENKNTKITLQIDNPIAVKEVDGLKEEITLDTAPTIVDNRTLVPLRFIAESIDKQVGWDSDARTAVIIDYHYFSEELAKKSPNLYQFLTTVKDYAQIDYIQKYTDLENGANNNQFSMKLYATLKEGEHEDTLTITGTSELAKEIIQESWNSTIFTTKFQSGDVIFTSKNSTLNEMIRRSDRGALFQYKDLGLYGNPEASIDDFFKIWSGVEEKDLRITTFSALKEDFKKMCDMVKTNNNEKTVTIQYASYGLQYFDFFKLDNIIVSNDFIKAFNFVTKMFFKFDLKKDTVLYDYDKVIVRYTPEPNRLVINIEANNSYQEKYEIQLILNQA